MKKLISVIVFCVFMYACSSVPVTGRSQLSLVSNQEVLSLSLQEYNDYISSAPKSTNKANAALVTKVGQNIANAVAAYYQQNGMASELSDYSWEFNLIADSQVNAFCMPGGKIVVYEGILPYTQDESGLAVVLGHEVAHAIAKHANERMSQQVVAQYGSAAVGSLLSKSPAALQTIGNTVFGIGAQYGVMLPFSRKQESEADHIGLVLMAIAGYNPNTAIPFWQRMSQQGTAVPEFMSTHPSDSKRISEIQKELPEAMKYYTGAKGSSTPSNVKASDQWKF